jgi:hypothetical protein
LFTPTLTEKALPINCCVIAISEKVYGFVVAVVTGAIREE